MRADQKYFTISFVDDRGNDKTIGIMARNEEIALHKFHTRCKGNRAISCERNEARERAYWKRIRR